MGGARVAVNERKVSGTLNHKNPLQPHTSTQHSPTQARVWKFSLDGAVSTHQPLSTHLPEIPKTSAFSGTGFLSDHLRHILSLIQMKEVHPLGCLSPCPQLLDKFGYSQPSASAESASASSHHHRSILSGKRKVSVLNMARLFLSLIPNV